MNESNPPKGRRTGAAAAFVDAELARGCVAFSILQLARETGLGAEAAKSQLRRLGSKVVRVSPKQKFFLIVSPEHLSRGAPPVEWWLGDYFRWLSHPYYLALQSAAVAYGSSPQSIQVTQVVTDAPRRPIRVGKLKVSFFVKRAVARTPTQEPPNAFAPTRISTPAATGFDLIRYAPRIGGMGRAVETLVPLLPLVRGADLHTVLEAERETATAQRLGYLVERAGRSALADVIDHWLPARRPVIPLVSGRAGRPAGPVASRWHVVNNS